MITEAECREQYIGRVSQIGRSELLKLCRAGGLTANKNKTDAGLAEVLWNHFGRKAYLFQAAKERAFA